MESSQAGFEEFTHYLNEQEAANPELVIEDFFNFSSLQESKLLLWNWLKILTGEDFDQMDDHEQNKLLWFYVKLEKLVEAAYILNTRDTSGWFPDSYSAHPDSV